MQEQQTNSPVKSKRRGVFKTVVDLAFIAFCAGLSIFYLYIGNVTQLKFKEIAPLLLVFAGIGWLIYLILRLTLKSSLKAALISGVIMAVLTNAGLLTNHIGYIPVLLISAAVIVGLSFVVSRLKDGSVAEKFEFIIAGVIAALIIFNVATSLPLLSENERLSKLAAEKAAKLEKIEPPEKYAAGDAKLPNFYVFIFDELAGTQCMKEVYGYDNTGFYDDMREIGFNVADKSTNYKQFTMECLSGFFNLEYAFDYDTDGYFSCGERFANAKFFSLMEQMGYDLYETEVAGFVDYTPRFKYGTTKEYHVTEDGRTSLDVILDRTVFGPLVETMDIYTTNYDHYNRIMDHYTQPESYTYSNAMTFTYIGCPHAPFIYDANGNPVDDTYRMDWSDPKYYLEQYEYMCGRIEETMKGIVQNDPDSIILVLSDHGVKPNKAIWNGPATNYEQSVDTFFAAYTGGRDDLGDINGLSGADILRTVLNKEFGFDLKMAGAPKE